MAAVNAFDGRKVIYHMLYWSAMERGIIPPPVLVTLDPINRCNLACDWCNGKARIEKGGSQYDDAAIDELPGVLAKWGVKAVCIAGGGEPLMHRRAGDLICGLAEHGIEVGVVTNGTLIGRHLDALGRCRWVGVSVDAGNADTYTALKGINRYADVLKNIRALTVSYPLLEVTFKYLVAPGNIRDIVSAARDAASAGCVAFHARPVGRTWEEVASGNNAPLFDEADVAQAKDEIARAKLEVVNSPMRFHATADKFDGKWQAHFPFSSCHAVGMTCVIEPTGTVGLCCDRRGDARVQLGQWGVAADIPFLWGTPYHWQVMKSINMQECPRCTYAPHNELYEQFVERDDCCRNFI